MRRAIQAERIARGWLRAATGWLLAVLCFAPVALAQRHGGGMGPGGPGGFGGGGFGRPGGNIPSGIRPMHGGMQLGPPGRWWDDKHIVKLLHLRPDQQHRMDAIFEESKPVLVKRFEALEQEQQRMFELTHANQLDENALFGQIDRIEQARADLEKAKTHLLFQIRGEMDADQLAQLEELRQLPPQP